MAATISFGSMDISVNYMYSYAENMSRIALLRAGYYGIKLNVLYSKMLLKNGGVHGFIATVTVSPKVSAQNTSPQHLDGNAITATLLSCMTRLILNDLRL